jgi:hypothetical protein
MPRHASPIASSVESLLLLTVSVAGNPEGDIAERHAASKLCRALSSHASASTQLFEAAFVAARSLVHVDPSDPSCTNMLDCAIELAPMPGDIVGSLLELAEAAHVGGHHSVVASAIVWLCDVSPFDGIVPASWFAAMRDLTGGYRHRARTAVMKFVSRFGGTNEGLRELVRANEAWFLDPIPIRILREIHRAVPTTTGWSVLALRRGELPPGPLGISFGNEHDEAVRTVHEALESSRSKVHRSELRAFRAELTETWR